MPASPTAEETVLAARVAGQAILKALKVVLPAVWAFDDTASPRVRDCRTRERPSLGQSDVTALLAQSLVGGHLIYCGNVDGERRYANMPPWGAFDLMPDFYNAASIEDDGTVADPVDLLRDDPDLAARFANFRRRAMRFLAIELAARLD